MKKMKVIFLALVFIILICSTNIIYQKYVENFNKIPQYISDNDTVTKDLTLDPITSNQKIVQVLNFQDSNNSIAGLGLCFATYGRENQSKVLIKITDDITSKVMLNKSIDAKELKDNEYYNIMFDEPCKTNKLTVEITSDTEKSDQAVTLWLTDSSHKTARGITLATNDNELYRNNNRLDGSICTNTIYVSLPMEKQKFIPLWILISLLLVLMLYVIVIIIVNYVILIKNSKRYLANFKQYLPLLKELVIKEIKLKYKRSSLGFAWSILNPLLMMWVMTIVFSTLFKSNIKNFPVYLILGQVVFNFYSEATNAAMGSIIAGTSLINKVYIPKYIFPMSKVLSSLVNLLFSVVAVIIVIIVTKVNITTAIFLFPLGILYVTVFALGIGFILSTCTVFFRDIIHLYGVVLLAWTYLTPIFYPIDIIPKEFISIAKANPMYCFITYFRQIVLEGTIPNIGLNMICMLYALLALIIGTIVFYRNQDKFILHL